jgi:protein-tyrosine-phosphatase
MAAAWLEHLAGGKVVVLSGGSAPGVSINPRAVLAMNECGIDIAARTPRRWTDADVGEADVVVTMGCGDECPFIPGKHYEDWDVADPAEAEMDGVRAIRDDIEARVRQLLATLAQMRASETAGG